MKGTDGGMTWSVVSRDGRFFYSVAFDSCFSPVFIAGDAKPSCGSAYEALLFQKMASGSIDP